MRLDNLIQKYVNNIQVEYDFTDVSDEELEELEKFYEKAGNIWNGSEYLEPDFCKLTKDEQLRLDAIFKKIKIKQVLRKSIPNHRRQPNP